MLASDCALSYSIRPLTTCRLHETYTRQVPYVTSDCILHPMMVLDGVMMRHQWIWYTKAAQEALNSPKWMLITDLVHGLDGKLNPLVPGNCSTWSLL